MPRGDRLFFATLTASVTVFLSAGSLSAQQSAQARLETVPDAPTAQAAGTAAPLQAGHPASSNTSSAKPAETDPNAARLGGTVTDTNGDIVPGATVVLEGPTPDDRLTTTASDNASFEFDGVKPGIPYHLAVQAKGFADWRSDALKLASSEFHFVTDIRLQLLGEATSITVTASSPEEIATQQVQIEEQQRVLGFIPNFYVVYDAKNAVPLTTKLKFQMAYRVSIDPVSFFGAAFLGAIDQAADNPNYPQGWGGYGERVGSIYADGFTDIMFGGAILPSLLHQDPRYFYQGTGTVKSRALHAMSNPFICRGDNGKLQPNYSSIGGDLISSALSNVYYPPSNRGAAFTFEGVAIATAERTVSSLIQEFVIRKLTPSARRQN